MNVPEVADAPAVTSATTIVSRSVPESFEESYRSVQPLGGEKGPGSPFMVVGADYANHNRVRLVGVTAGFGGRPTSTHHGRNLAELGLVVTTPA